MVQRVHHPHEHTTSMYRRHTPIECLLVAHLPAATDQNHCSYINLLEDPHAKGGALTERCTSTSPLARQVSNKPYHESQ